MAHLSYIASVFFFSIALMSTASAIELDYRFDGKSSQCVNDKGEVGLNADYLGECGLLGAVDYTYARISWPLPPKFQGAKFLGTNLTKSFLAEANFTSATLRGVDFTGANLKRATFQKTVFDQVTWSGAFLYEARFSEVDLTGADFRRASLVGVRMESVNLEEADFSRNSLNLASFKGSNLTGARFVGAGLGSVDFSEADLSDADFSSSILFAADLTNSITLGTNFQNAKYDNRTRLPFDQQEALRRGMKLFSDGSAPIPTQEIKGASDGTCSPVSIHISKGVAVEFVLNGESQMFLFEARQLGIELMSMPGQPARKVITPRDAGTFEFTCGPHGGAQKTKGAIMVM